MALWDCVCVRACMYVCVCWKKKQQSFPRSFVPVSGSRMRSKVRSNRRYFLFCMDGYPEASKTKWSLLRHQTETENGFTERVVRMQLQVSQPDQQLTQFVCSPCLTLPSRRRPVSLLLTGSWSLVNFGHKLSLHCQGGSSGSGQAELRIFELHNPDKFFFQELK